MSSTTYKQAINRALSDALGADDRVYLLGEDIAAAGGAFKTTEGLMAEHGERRVLDTPIAEQAILGTAIGSALKGLRPVAELMFADFAGVCYDQIANQMAKYRYMTGGQVSLPITVRLANGAGAGFGAQHSQSVENWFLNVPGLKMVAPATPADAYGLLRAAIDDPDPVLFFEHKAMYNVKEDWEGEPGAVAIGRAAVVREGSDVTVVATQLMRGRAEAAAATLAERGIELEIVDPRTIAPLDFETITQSVDKTNHLVVVQESSAAGSWGGTVVAEISTNSFESLDAPPLLLSAPDAPIPYAGQLEEAWLPSEERIVKSISTLIGA